MADTDGYITNDAWVRIIGRPDAIDEIADQFERRVVPKSDSAPTVADERLPRWPQHSRGWRSIARLHPQPSRMTA